MEGYGKVPPPSDLTEPAMTPRSDQPADRTRRRQILAFTTAMIMSGALFVPWLWSLYKVGSIFFSLFVALLWLALGRFCYQWLAPPAREAKQNGRPEAAREPTRNGNQ